MPRTTKLGSFRGDMPARKKFLRIFPGGFRDADYVDLERAYKWDTRGLAGNARPEIVPEATLGPRLPNHGRYGRSDRIQDESAFFVREDGAAGCHQVCGRCQGLCRSALRIAARHWAAGATIFGLGGGRRRFAAAANESSDLAPRSSVVELFADHEIAYFEHCDTYEKYQSCR